MAVKMYESRSPYSSRLEQLTNFIRANMMEIETAVRLITEPLEYIQFFNDTEKQEAYECLSLIESNLRLIADDISSHKNKTTR